MVEHHLQHKQALAVDRRQQERSVMIDLLDLLEELRTLPKSPFLTTAPQEWKQKRNEVVDRISLLAGRLPNTGLRARIEVLVTVCKTFNYQEGLFIKWDLPEELARTDLARDCQDAISALLRGDDLPPPSSSVGRVYEALEIYFEYIRAEALRVRAEMGAFSRETRMEFMRRQLADAAGSGQLNDDGDGDFPGSSRDPGHTESV